MSREILLTQGKISVVDDADYEWLNRYTWCAHKRINTYYAYRHSHRENGKAFYELMHRKILGLRRKDKRDTDHIDGNGLNNQRSNLRICTRTQNQQNQRCKEGGTSKYKGVCWDKEKKKWAVIIRVNGKSIRLGRFNNEIDAGLAYNRAAQELFGEFAKLNEIGD